MKKGVALLLLVVTMFSNQVDAVNIKFLKGTHDILPAEDVYYSPAYGLPFIEEGVAENIYNASGRQVERYVKSLLGRSYKKGDSLLVASPRSRAVEEEVMRFVSRENNGTENLVSCLFHRAGVQTSFLPTKVDPVQKLQPRDIGVILRLIKVYEKYARSLPQERSHLAKMLAELDLAHVGDNQLNQYLGDYFKAKQDRQIYLKHLLQQSLKKYLIKIDSSSKVWNKFINALIASLHECWPSDSKALYPLRVTQGLLLGYMLLQVNSKNDLALYFEGFTTKGVSLLDEEYSVAELSAAAQSAPPVSDGAQFAEWLCGYVYEKNYNSLLPKFTNAQVVMFGGHYFTDCVETVIRNICNIVTYNSQLHELGDLRSMSHRLKQFYEKHKEPAKLGDIRVHQDWVPLVQNIPGLIYACIGKSDGSTLVKFDQYSDEDIFGFIPVRYAPVHNSRVIHKTIGDKNYKFYKKILNGKTYLMVPEETGLVCFEMRSEISNIVVMLNVLFGLDVCDSVLRVGMFDVLKFFAKSTFLALGLQFIDIKIEKENHERVFLKKGHEQFVLNVFGIHTGINLEEESVLSRNLLEGVTYQAHSVESSALVSLSKDISVESLIKIADGKSFDIGKLLSYVFAKTPIRKLHLFDQLYGLNLWNLNLGYTRSLLLRLPFDTEYYYQKLLFQSMMKELRFDNISRDVLHLLRTILNIIDLLEGSLPDIFLLYRLYFDYALDRNKVSLDDFSYAMNRCLSYGGDLAEEATVIFRKFIKIGYFKRDVHIENLLSLFLHGLKNHYVWESFAKLGLQCVLKKLITQAELRLIYCFAIKEFFADRRTHFFGLSVLKYGLEIKILEDSELLHLVGLVENTAISFEEMDAIFARILDRIIFLESIYLKSVESDFRQEISLSYVQQGGSVDEIDEE